MHWIFVLFTRIIVLGWRGIAKERHIIYIEKGSQQYPYYYNIYIYIYLCIYVYMYVCIEFGDTFFYLEGHAHKISNVMKMNGLAKAIEFVNPKLSGTERT